MIDRKKSVIENGKRFKGQAYLLRHLDGKSLTRNQAIAAKCYECMGYYTDGAQDCEIPDCPLYKFMPFRGKTAKAAKLEISEEGQGPKGEKGQPMAPALGKNRTMVASA